jgi:hypothetical protein
MQVPSVSSEAELPETVQMVGVLEVNVTASPELAVADSGKLVKAYCVPVMVGKEMVWPVGFTVSWTVVVAVA